MTNQNGRCGPVCRKQVFTFKVENGLPLSEAATLEELEWVIERQMRYYNRERRHSGVGSVPPVEYFRPTRLPGGQAGPSKWFRVRGADP